MSAIPVEPGQSIDGFRVVSLLHRGGMATLWRVERAGAAFPLVMKVPHLAQGDDPVTVVSYEVEQTMLRALRGPHVPQLVAVGDLQRLPYLVMEFIDGATLQSLVGKVPLAVDDIVRWAAPVADALDDLHRQQLAHLDVKPSNIVFRASGSAVLIDLGLAHHGHYPDLLAEEFRKPIGSAPYMAPEQVVGMRSDPRSDIFALGAILYQLATGHLPFGSPTSVGGLRQRLHRYPKAPRALRPDLPPWLQELILHCLEVDASRRPSAWQVANWLRAPHGVALTVRGTRTRDPGPLVRVRRWLWAAGFEPAAPSPETLQSGAAAMVLVPVSVRHGEPALQDALRAAVAKIAAADYALRIVVATVIPPSPLLGSSGGESGGAAHLRHLVELKEWAAGLQLAETRITCHVLEAHDPAQALVDFAHHNPVRQIVIGAPPLDGNPKLGIPLKPVVEAVASRVALLAPCSVLLVRPGPAP